MFPKVTLILGGAASGKSAWAEEFVETCGKSKVYLATSQVLDAEMQAKIDLHSKRRDESWTLIEEDLDLISPLGGLDRQQICLIDCATLWLSNHLLEDHDLPATQTALLGAIDTCAADLVIVSNEVGNGIVPQNPLARRFREAQGRLNIELAKRADLVVQITAGLPMVLKGRLP